MRESHRKPARAFLGPNPSNAPRERSHGQIKRFGGDPVGFAVPRIERGGTSAAEEDGKGKKSAARF